MGEKIPSRQLSGEVPAKLIEDFDAMAERLGFVKKRAMAAAVAAMIHADLETQHVWYRQVYERYYSTATPADELSDKPHDQDPQEIGRRLGDAARRGQRQARTRSDRERA